MNNRISHLLIPALVCLALGGCKPGAGGADVDTMPEHLRKVLAGGSADTAKFERAPEDEAAARYREAKKKIVYKKPAYNNSEAAQSAPMVKASAPKPAAVKEAPASRCAAAPQPSAATPKAKSQSETVYVETDCLYGRIWGHITMKGGQGRGTIHDEEENNLAVTAIRKGNEILATDQNGRHYAFKLK